MTDARSIIDTELDATLAALAGLALARLGRAGDTLWIQLGPLQTIDGDDGDASPREVGTHGDLLTPADADVELEDYDWDEPGASWLDVRLGELNERLAQSPRTVRRATRDAWLGLRLALDDDSTIELFPNSTPTGHVSTEFWRVLQPGSAAPHLVTGTFGIDREG